MIEIKKGKEPYELLSYRKKQVPITMLWIVSRRF